MDREENDSIKIQRYLDGDMTGAERLEFEKELQHDPALQSLAATYSTLSEGIRYHVRYDAWEKIQQLEAAHADEAILIAGSKKKSWLYAAMVSLILLAFGTVYVFNLNVNKGSDLFEEHFNPYPVLAHAPVRGGDTTGSLKERAFSAYSNENYQRAIPLLEELDKGEEEYLVKFYLGNAYLATGEPEEAIMLFRSVLESQSALDPQAQWYLGLSYLAKGDKEGAKAVFGELANDSSSYGSKAKTIFNQL